MKTDHTIDNELLKLLDFDAGDAPTSRRDAIRKAGRIGGGLALAALPLSAFFTPKMAYAQDPIGILNYALTLEYLEWIYYREANDAGVVEGSDDRAVFQLIEQHERDHVEFLTATINSLGGTPVEFTEDNFDYTANGSFMPFENYAQFLLISQAFEDTGVRAYKGQAPNLVGSDLLTPALQIHALEARHAAEVRRIRAQSGASFAQAPWIILDSNSDGSPIEPVYAGAGENFPPEENVNQAGVDITSLGYSREEASAAFDEPLPMNFVVGIADLFVVGDFDGDGMET